MLTPRFKALLCASLCTSILLFSGLLMQLGAFQSLQSSDEDAFLLLNEWQEISGPPFRDRTGHVLLLLDDDSVLLMGGEQDGIPKNDVWRSDDEGESWDLVIKNAGWEPRKNFAATQQAGGSVFVMGGNSNDEPLNHVWRSDDKGQTWEPVFSSPDQNHPFSPRENIQAVSLDNGTLLVFDGERGSEVFNEIIQSVDDGQSWTVANSDPLWSERTGLQVVHQPEIQPSISEYVYAVGGFVNEQFSNQVYRFNPVNSQWSTITSSANLPVYLDFSVHLTEGENLVITGISGTTEILNDVRLSTDSGNSWTRIQADWDWEPRYNPASTILSSDRILLSGGRDADENEPLDDIIRVDRQSQAPPYDLLWPGPGWDVREQHSLALTSDGRLLTIGGFRIDDQGMDELNRQVWINNMEGRSQWEQLDDFPGSNEIRGHTSTTYTDGSIYVFGGISSNSNNPDFNRYQVTEDNGFTWNTGTAEELTRRFSHAAVLSGRRILLIGGITSSGLSDDVAAFDPRNGDSFSSTTAGWSARHGLAAAVNPTNGRIIISGGTTQVTPPSGNSLNDVWMSANGGQSWTEQTSQAPWEQRHGHTMKALPDGRLLLMGGKSETTFYSDVWISSDEGETWTEVTDEAPWGPRSNMAATTLENGNIILAGGSSADIVQHNDVWELQVGTPDNPSETFQTSAPGTNDGWRMLGSPVQHTTYAELLNTIWTQGYPGSSAGPTDLEDISVRWFNSQDQIFKAPSHADDLVGGNQSQGYQSAGKGVFVYMFGPVEPGSEVIEWPKLLNVTGEPNDGLILKELHFSPSQPDNGWNLVSNPYPYSILWSSVQADSPNISDVAYIWDPNLSGGADYIYSITSDPFDLFDGRIPPFQAFWVRTTGEDPAPRILFKPEHRTGHEADLLREPVDTSPYLRFSLSAGDFETYAGLILRDHDDISAGEAGTFDVFRLASLSPDFLHLYFLSDNGIPLQVYNQPRSGPETYAIPFDLNTTQPGPYTLSLPELHEFDNWEASITDHAEGITKELYDGFEYEFNQPHSANKTGADTQKVKDLTSLESVTAPADKSSGTRFTLHLNRTATGSEQLTDLPRSVKLDQNYPNPFNPTTQIRYQIPESQHVRLEVFDITGRQISVLQDQQVSAGTHTIMVDASRWSSGVYLYRLHTTGSTITRKMLLIK